MRGDDAGSRSFANRVAGAAQLRWTFDLEGGPQLGLAPRLELVAGDIVYAATDAIVVPTGGTGVRGYPVQEAASAALAGVIEDLREHGAPGLVRFVLFGPSMLEIYLEAAHARLRQ